MFAKVALPSRGGRCLKLNLLQYHHKYYYYAIISSDDAVKRIKDLQKNDKQNMITEAFEIYNTLNESQKNDEFVIGALLNCCKIILKKKQI